MSRKAQIGPTATWVVATLIIIIVLFIFLAISAVMSKSKAIKTAEVKTDLGENSEQLSMKTNLAEQLTENKNKAAVDKILGEQNG